MNPGTSSRSRPTNALPRFSRRNRDIPRSIAFSRPSIVFVAGSLVAGERCDAGCCPGPGCRPTEPPPSARGPNICPHATFVESDSASISRPVAIRWALLDIRTSSWCRWRKLAPNRYNLTAARRGVNPATAAYAVSNLSNPRGAASTIEPISPVVRRGAIAKTSERIPHDHHSLPTGWPAGHRRARHAARSHRSALHATD